MSYAHRKNTESKPIIIIINNNTINNDLICQNLIQAGYHSLKELSGLFITDGKRLDGLQSPSLVRGTKSHLGQCCDGHYWLDDFVLQLRYFSLLQNSTLLRIAATANAIPNFKKFLGPKKLYVPWE